MARRRWPVMLACALCMAAALPVQATDPARVVWPAAPLGLRGKALQLSTGYGSVPSGGPFEGFGLQLGWFSGVRRSANFSARLAFSSSERLTMTELGTTLHLCMWESDTRTGGLGLDLGAALALGQATVFTLTPGQLCGSNGCVTEGRELEERREAAAASFTFGLTFDGAWPEHGFALATTLGVQTFAEERLALEDGIWWIVRQRLATAGKTIGALRVSPYLEATMAVGEMSGPTAALNVGVAMARQGPQRRRVLSIPAHARLPGARAVPKHQPRPLVMFQGRTRFPDRGRPAQPALETCARRSTCKVFGLCGAGISGTCLAASDAACRASRMCEFYGQCSRRSGACAAANSVDCKRSLACRSDGECTFSEGRCVQGSSAECQTSALCSFHGLCSWSFGRCVAATNADCRNSVRCKTHGECGAVQGRCRATRDVDCQGLAACRMHGQCRAIRGQCRAGSSAECAASLDCRRFGACKARSGYCTQQDTADCAAWPPCAQAGICTYVLGNCMAGGHGECRRSQRCRLYDECVHRDGLCWPDLCRKRFECHYRGLCTSVGGRCRAVDDYACQRSMACKVEGACSARNGRCQPGSSSECARSQACATHGRCVFAAGDCVRGR